MTVPEDQMISATGSTISRRGLHRSGHTPKDFSLAAVDIIDKSESLWAQDMDINCFLQWVHEYDLWYAGQHLHG